MLKYIVVFFVPQIFQRRLTVVKEGIHPDYKQTTITCASGEVIETGSTKENIQHEICSKCHPFFTGRQRFAAAQGRIEKFNKKYGLK